MNVIGTMFKRALFVLILRSCTFVLGNVYSTCYEYQTYCLFSFGPNVTVNNVDEAQKMCEDAKHGSWLLEIVNKKILEKVDIFVGLHPFPKNTSLILNAKKDGNNKWRWIKNQTAVADVNNMIRGDDGDVMVFQPLKKTGSNISKPYTLVCMIGCPSKLIKHKGKRYVGATHYKSKQNEEKCSEECERLNCEAWEWETGTYTGCWIHTKISGEMSGNPSGTLHTIDPSGKGYSNCADNVTVPVFRDSGPKDSIVLCVCLLLVLVALMLIAAIIFWRRRKQKLRSGHQSRDLQKNVYSSTVFSGLGDKVPPSSPSYYLETEQPDTNIGGLVYADLSHLPKQNKNKKQKGQTIGPMGDVYSQVKR